MPRRCPHAYVTLASEPHGVNTGSAGLDKAQDDKADSEEIGRYRDRCDEVPLTTAQRRLPEAICWQTEAGNPEFASTDVAAMCYEMMCARNNLDSGGQVRPSFCASLVAAGPPAGAGGVSLNKLVLIAAAMMASALAARMQVKVYRSAPWSA